MGAASNAKTTRNLTSPVPLKNVVKGLLIALTMPHNAKPVSSKNVGCNLIAHPEMEKSARKQNKEKIGGNSNCKT